MLSSSPLKVRPWLKIFAGWFLGSPIIGVGLIFLLRPMAGLLMLLGVTTMLAMTTAPIVHIVMRSKGVENFKIVRTLLIGVVVVIFLLGFSGIFNFT